MSESSDPVDRAAQANARFHPVNIDADTVTRPADSTTETVHNFLRHLRSKGSVCVPEPLGIEDGIEKLRYIEGDSGGQGWYHQHNDRGLSSAARLLRLIHDAGSDWSPPAGAAWGAEPVAGQELVFCHGDPGPWNFVWRDEEAVGLIDWDYLHPAPRLDDVAYALRWFVPLRADEHVLDWHHFPTIPDRGARIRTFLQAYGDLPSFDVVSTVVQRMQTTSDLVLSLAEQGIEPQRSWVADGSQEREAEEMAWIERHRSELGL
jgi:Phosphotransferase enzyme family